MPHEMASDERPRERLKLRRAATQAISAAGPLSRSLGSWGRHPALLDPAPLVTLDRLSERNAFGRLRRDVRGLGGKTGRPATAPILRTTAPIATTFPSLRAAAVTATIAFPLANAGTTAAELVAVDALVEAADRATGPAASAGRPSAGLAAPAAIASRAAAAAAASHSLAALSIA